MVLEKPHSLYNYFFLNNNLVDLLKSQRFTRVNKVFIEYEDEIDAKKSFENSKFYYALDAIVNILQMIVYLPTDDQLETFLKKTKRHEIYVDNKNKRKQFELQQKQQQQQHIDEMVNSSTSNNTTSTKVTDESTFDSYDIISSVQSSTNTLSSINVSENENQLPVAPFSPSSNSTNATSTTTATDQDSLSSMIKNIEPIKLIEDHFIREKIGEAVAENDASNKACAKNEKKMETSFDEGIGSTGSLSTNTNNNNNLLKNSPVSPYENANLMLSIPKLSPISYNEKEDILPRANSDTDLNLNDDIGRFDDEADLDVNIDDNEINNLDDDIDFDNDILVNNNPGDEELDDMNDCYETEQNSSNLVVSSLLNEFKGGKYTKVKFSDYINEPNWDEALARTAIESGVNDDDLPPLLVPAGISTTANSHFDYATEVDEALPSYEELNEKAKNTPRTSAGFEDTYGRVNNARFIKSNLISNAEFGTKTLEIKMDKRIDLNEFKAHIDEYLKLSSVNFRVFRMCPNDIECELTSYESQFLYLAQNSKFIIKLGPPLRYGEYVLPVYKLNKPNGNFTYLCDFMIMHGMSVMSHKELLSGDLKDECNLDFPVEK